MSLFNEIQTGRLSAILSKLLGIEGAPSPQLGSDIIPGLILENDRPEYHFLGGGMLTSAFQTRAADAANFSLVGLFNGANTGVLAVLEALILQNLAGVARDYHIRVQVTTALGGSIFGAPRDLRWVNKQSALQVGTAVAAALTGVQTMRVRVPAGQTLIYPFPYVMPQNISGSGFPSNVVITGNAINEDVAAGFIWRERYLELSEQR